MGRIAGVASLLDGVAMGVPCAIPGCEYRHCFAIDVSFRQSFETNRKCLPVVGDSYLPR
jgi:hypothetical protein